MYFENNTTRAVTEKDVNILFQVCITLRAISFVGKKVREENSNWLSRDVECHSVARMIFLFHKELTLSDGFILGIDLLPDGEKVQVVNTHHSWLKTPDGAIIDPYPVGLISTASAILIPTTNKKSCAHGSNLYHECPTVREHFDVKKSWENARSYFRFFKRHYQEEYLSEIVSGII